jgi:Fe-S-cluster containining protein
MKPPCSTCKANCCQYVPMTNTEYAVLQATKPRKVLPDKWMRIGDEHRLIIGRCPWVTKDHKCSVYDVRPFICRAVGTMEMPCEKMPGAKEALEKIVDKYWSRKT